MAYPTYRALAYGPSQGENTVSTTTGPFGQLQQGDIAVSPNLLKQYPLGSMVNAVDPETGEILRSNLRVADTSYIGPGKPTKNSFELWNDEDLGHASLVPAGNQRAVGTGTTAVPNLPPATPLIAGTGTTAVPSLASSATTPAVANRIAELNAAIGLSRKKLALANTGGLFGSLFGAPRAQPVIPQGGA